MTGSSDERYDLEIPDEGLSYDILDTTFNPTTETFLIQNGIKPGMRVLDVGSGSGFMTHFLAQQVGNQGHVHSIDLSPEQLARAKRYCDKQGDTNITFQQLSAYDLDTLQESFDMVYCRFVLHHLHSPRKAIALFYHCLRDGGLYVGEEGIISAAFSYPPTPAWVYNREIASLPENENDGVDRDGDFGMKLAYWMKKSGFDIGNANLVQPLLHTKSQKKMLMEGHYAYKNTALADGMDEKKWLAQTVALNQLVEDDFSIVGFYQSCQVCGIKQAGSDIGKM
jgi:SAM-dependent methyltransferase